MGGRYGKYGDFKRQKALRQGRKLRTKLENTKRIALRCRRDLPATGKSHSPAFAAKTYKTAVVAIPPDHLWGPIQGLRKQYDRHFRRWMPHITLLYP